MVDVYKDFAAKCKEFNIAVNTVGINMSKTRAQAQQLGISAYPTIRLYKKDGSTAEFEQNPSTETFMAFLRDNGVQF